MKYNFFNFKLFTITIGFLTLFFTSCEEDGVLLNQKPTVTITSPENDLQTAFGEEITFSCSAVDVEDGVLMDNSITWKSDIDGVIGSGKAITISTLSLTSHTIVVTAVDQDGESATDTVVVTLMDVAVPTIRILNIENNSEFAYGSEVTFKCSAHDAVDGVLTGNSVTWTSDIDGLLGHGDSLMVSTLSEGNHEVIARAEDHSGNSITDTVFIEIYEEIGHLEIMMARMTGSFSSENQANTSSDPYHYDVRRKAQRIWSDEADGYWLYIEQAFAGSESSPYFQRVYHFFVEDDSVKNIVYKINNASAFIGSWETPEDFETITIDGLSEREECGATFYLDNDHYYGTTKGKNCLSTLSGVSYMTSEQWVYEDHWNSYDLGWNNNDIIVMGPYSPYVFDKVEDFPFYN